MFSQTVSTKEGQDKLAAEGGNWIRDRLREVSFADKLLPPKPVTRKDCQVSTETDTLVKIVELEPRTRAMSLSFRDDPTARLISGQRTAAAFYTISSEKLEKTEQELMVYEMPITKIMEDNTVKDMGEIKDREFLLHCEAAVQALQFEANGNVATELSSATVGTTIEFSVRKGEMARQAPTPNATPLALQRPDVVNGFKMLDGNRLYCEIVLMTQVDWDDLLQWTVEDFGDRIQSETTVDGYKYNTLLGRSVVRTIKTDILRQGNLYFFTDPKFFGHSYILNNIKFYIDKVANKISMQAWMDVGMILANVAAVRKVELYSGDANPATNAQSLLASFTPVAEEALGALNNRVGAGIRFPGVQTY
jgi:hypothetical protein